MRVVAAILYAVAVAVIAGIALAFAAGGLGPRVAATALVAGALVGLASLWEREREPFTWPRLGPWEWAAVGAFTLFSLRAFLWVVVLVDDEIRVLSPNNLGDLSLHLTYIRQMANGVHFWPENPILAGAKLTYPLGIDLLHSLLVLVGADVWRCFVWIGLAGATLTGVALWRWGRGFVLAGFLFNGGLAGFAFLWHGQLLDYQAPHGWKSIPLALFATQRGLLYALPAGLALLGSWRHRYFGLGRPTLRRWGEWLLYAALPIFHLHTFIALSFLLAAWFCLHAPARRPILLLVGAALLPATALVLLVTAQLHGPSVLGWHFGWMQDDPDYLEWFRGWAGNVHGARLFFWPLNFGILPLLVGAVAWRLAVRQDTPGARLSPEERWAWCALLPAILLFLLCCVVKFAPWSWDNTKVMIWSYFLVLVVLWDQLFARWNAWLRVSVAVLLFGSGALSLAGGLGGPGFKIATRSELGLLEVALKPVPPESRFIAEPNYNHPLLLLGHPLALGYIGHVMSHGYDYKVPLERVHAILDGEGDWRGEAKKMGCRYLFWGEEERTAHPDSPQPWREQARLIASGDWGEVYDLESPTNP